MRGGIRLGVDVGSVRVGLAASDPGGILATPMQTLGRDLEHGSDQGAIAAVVLEHDVLEVVVGLPRSLSGGEGPAAVGARAYATALAARVSPVPVRLVDERLTTIDAHRQLRDSGVSGRAQRAVVDMAAAVLILQGALDAEMSSGLPPGELVAGRKPRSPRTKAGGSRR
ncbi:MAG: putative pre6S rRNA nuclease [Actinomycetota bacterium]|jgi:putative Holliday junction resolvase|nr:putative pre6S rRNA nuclease [Actinomycetota bacterium]